MGLVIELMGILQMIKMKPVFVSKLDNILTDDYKSGEVSIIGFDLCIKCPGSSVGRAAD